MDRPWDELQDSLQQIPFVPDSAYAYPLPRRFGRDRRSKYSRSCKLKDPTRSVCHCHAAWSIRHSNRYESLLAGLEVSFALHSGTHYRAELGSDRLANGITSVMITNTMTVPEIGRVKNTVQSFPNPIIEFMNVSPASGLRITPRMSGVKGNCSRSNRNPSTPKPIMAFVVLQSAQI